MPGYGIVPVFNEDATCDQDPSSRTPIPTLKTIHRLFTTGFFIIKGERFLLQDTLWCNPSRLGSCVWWGAPFNAHSRPYTVPRHVPREPVVLWCFYGLQTSAIGRKGAIKWYELVGRPALEARNHNAHTCMLVCFVNSRKPWMWGRTMWFDN